jgi:small multidrug resistance family-3 protein
MPLPHSENPLLNSGAKSPTRLLLKTLLQQFVATPAGAFAVLAIAAYLEVYGDACFSSGLYHSTGRQRLLWFAAGGGVLVAYSLFLNCSQIDFGKLLGIYVVLFFVVAQLVAKFKFHQSPTIPIYAGGALIVLGGIIMTFWRV